MLDNMKKYYQHNKKQMKLKAKKWNKEHPEVGAKIAKRWRKNNPDKRKNNNLKSKYGISLEDYNVLLESQKNVCAICKRDNFRSMVVDHCHLSSKVRGS